MTQLATIADRMAATLSRLTSPSWAIYPAAITPVTKLARGIKTLSYNTN
jgi:hypothetical protein